MTFIFFVAQEVHFCVIVVKYYAYRRVCYVKKQAHFLGET